MAKWIDADELKNAIHESYNPYQDYWAGTISRMHELIDEQPTVDAVEVVRCKDCRHKDFRYYNKQEVYCYKLSRSMCAKDFCCLGTKMDGGDE